MQKKNICDTIAEVYKGNLKVIVLVKA